VKKEMMAIEKIESTKAASKSPPKKVILVEKSSQKEHHFRLKRRLRGYSEEELRRLGIKF